MEIIYRGRSHNLTYAVKNFKERDIFPRRLKPWDTQLLVLTFYAKEKDCVFCVQARPENFYKSLDLPDVLKMSISSAIPEKRQHEIATTKYPPMCMGFPEPLIRMRSEGIRELLEWQELKCTPTFLGVPYWSSKCEWIAGVRGEEDELLPIYETVIKKFLSWNS